jgi:hypothetical protein
MPSENIKICEIHRGIIDLSKDHLRVNATTGFAAPRYPRRRQAGLHGNSSDKRGDPQAKMDCAPFLSLEAPPASKDRSQFHNSSAGKGAKRCAKKVAAHETFPLLFRLYW